MLQLAIAKELLRRASAVESTLFTYSGSDHAALAATGSSSATSSSSTSKPAHDVTRSSFWSSALKASYRVHVQQNPTTPMTSQQLCGSALALFWAALQRQDESRLNASEKRIFGAGQDALMQDKELPGVCLRWMRQAKSQAATIRKQEGLGKRKGAGGGGAMTQKRPCSSAPFASPIVESASTSTSTSTGADGSAGDGDGTAACPATTTSMATS